jgi:hypothetical protein
LAQEFTNALLTLLGVTVTVAGVLFWRMLTRMEEKIDQWWKEHMDCRERQGQLFVTRGEFKEWKEGRKELWERINKHTHTSNGRVVIKD